MNQICTCTSLNCPLHPSRHNDGCTPCIAKNLKTREMPSCFFNLVEGAADRKGDSLRDFADLVIQAEARSGGLQPQKPGE